MAAVLSETELRVDDAQSAAPIVVVGTGPAGARAVQELTRRMPQQPIVWCGAESCEPYNRVHLSSLLAGELGLDRFGGDYTISPEAWLDRRLGCEITQIDRSSKTIIDAQQRTQSYSHLILATGSLPRIPKIPGVELSGVYTFRNFADAQALFARAKQGRRTVVIGGGLLGLEAAKAMHRFNNEVTVVEYSKRLMTRQLDDHAAQVLRTHIEALGIEVLLSKGVKAILGNKVVTGVQLDCERIIECDTVIVAAGITPNVELARRAGLDVHNGIQINDATRTSDPYIYAIGECAEHRGVVYGLAAPGIEQASVAAGVIAGETTMYDGTVTATRLKVVGMPVFSIGEVLDDEFASGTHAFSYCSEDSKTYARLVTKHGRLIGATAVGDIADVNRLQDAVTQHRMLWFWQRRSFSSTGQIWAKKQSVDVTQWPATSTVCNCMGVTRGQLDNALNAGCCTVEALAAKTGASTVCGSCKPLLVQLTGATKAKPSVASMPLLLLTIAAIVCSLVYVLPWSVPHARTVADLRFDFLWRESFWQQVSGYSLLGLSSIAAVLSLRKRMKRFTIGNFDWWRVVHVAIGLFAIVAFAAHTGGRLGSKLNFALSLCLLSLIAMGSYAGIVIAREHALGVTAVAVRRKSIWLHIILFWPLPTLLTFHILKVYFF